MHLLDSSPPQEEELKGSVPGHLTEVLGVTAWSRKGNSMTEQPLWLKQLECTLTEDRAGFPVSQSGSLKMVQESSTLCARVCFHLNHLNHALIIIMDPDHPTNTPPSTGPGIEAPIHTQMPRGLRSSLWGLSTQRSKAQTRWPGSTLWLCGTGSPARGAASSELSHICLSFFLRAAP